MLFSRREIRANNLFNVADCKIHWQKNGDFLCVKVDRYAKSKKEKGEVKYSVSLKLMHLSLLSRDLRLCEDVLMCRGCIIISRYSTCGKRISPSISSKLKNLSTRSPGSRWGRSLPSCTVKRITSKWLSTISKRVRNYRWRVSTKLHEFIIRMRDSFSHSFVFRIAGEESLLSSVLVSRWPVHRARRVSWNRSSGVHRHERFLYDGEWWTLQGNERRMGSHRQICRLICERVDP